VSIFFRATMMDPLVLRLQPQPVAPEPATRTPWASLAAAAALCVSATLLAPALTGLWSAPSGSPTLRPGTALGSVTERPAGGLILSRRLAAFAPVPLVAVGTLAVPSLGFAAGYEPYEDSRLTLEYPSGWTATESTLADRRKLLVFTSGRDQNENINVVFSPVPGDFERIGAFGNVERAGALFTPNREGISSKMLAAGVWPDGEGYVYEYTQQIGARDNHFRTIMALIPGNYLVTVTAQTTSASWPTLVDTFTHVLNSFRLKP